MSRPRTPTCTHQPARSTLHRGVARREKDDLQRHLVAKKAWPQAPLFPGTLECREFLRWGPRADHPRSGGGSLSLVPTHPGGTDSHIPQPPGHLSPLPTTSQTHLTHANLHLTRAFMKHSHMPSPVPGARDIKTSKTQMPAPVEPEVGPSGEAQ